MTINLEVDSKRRKSVRDKAQAKLGRLGRRRKAFLDGLAATLESVGKGEPDPRDEWRPLTFADRLRLAPVLHDVWFLVGYWTGLRDRGRCPRCTSVGTFKGHGSLPERWFYGDISVRRWGCKWCGLWVQRQGRTQAFPSAKHGVWSLPGGDAARAPTPAEALFAAMGRVWPWLG